MNIRQFVRAVLVGTLLLSTTAVTTPAMAQWHGAGHYGWGGGWHGTGHYGWGGGWRPGWGYGWHGGWGWGWGAGWGWGWGLGLGLSAAWLAYPYSWYPWAYDPWLDPAYPAYPPGYAYNGQPPAAAVPNQSPTWYYCESAKSYYPYVPQCAEGWRAVPAMPPAPAH